MITVRKLLGAILLALLTAPLFAQETTIASNYKHINITATGNTAYARALILLHPMYNGVDLPNNYAVGHIVARRGGTNSYNRLDAVYVNSSSAYRMTTGFLSSTNGGSAFWSLKTCFYNGIKYLAVEVPYADGQHALGFQFAGWVTSSGEALKFIVYQVNGEPRNADVLTDIADYTPNMASTQHVSNFNILGRVGIGTTTPREALSVNGNIRAHEIKVETASWPDYVFQPDYALPTLSEVKAFINENGHLPDVPSASEVEREGVALGQMDGILLKKVEELTLYVIKLQEDNERLRELQQRTERRIREMEHELSEFKK